MMTQDAYEAERRRIQEQAAAGERARKHNVETFTRMWLTLGADVVKIAGTSHDAELAEARGLAAHRWSRLLDMEQQVVREEQNLAVRPKTRPAQPADDELPDRTLEKRNREWEDQTKAQRVALAELRKLASNERAELEAFVTKSRR